ncbi:mannose-1-phosphate guanylyltransferase/mannose-6-phosphate isomerase [Acinetobacter sp. Ver3]|uniref:mannose-1-phosphate guanylyltransferase/mannose-6-phosphate isomerase n=1 Tax=Acinetobacter sp. Ver3 TaxID=466088 RepID=UPI00044E74B2|nr:mannose-1-phosphate guanylyltransferase/mannose-6-phosphate isomerase [Acinetobacter sp. Ver3]EZQ11584.1 mannose-1-phosphate guanyltransferase [Acinetobacter sp. Ver3]
MSKVRPIIMAGGSGTRLWPLSRNQFPKQFLKLGQNKFSLLQSTILRLEGLNFEEPIIVCNEEHRFLVAEQMREIGIKPIIILEPAARNTAPAITLAAMYLNKIKEKSVMLVLAADHIIEKVAEFHIKINNAIDLAVQNKLVTFGVVPTHPETGYGYIEIGHKYLSGYNVDNFIEKPTLEVAKGFFKNKKHLWNSGMFVFSNDQFLKELHEFSSDIYNVCLESIKAIKFGDDFIRIDKKIFEKCRSESIDYAVMENTNNAVVVSLDVGWSDVGSWSALWEISPKDKNNNVCVGDILIDSSNNNYCYSETQLVSLLGVDNLIVVNTKDALLIANKNNVQEIKKIVGYLKENNRNEVENHRVVHRPWGVYDCIDQSDRYKVKRITVEPGHKLSMQLHYHRSEHWIVVKGTAKVYKNGETFLLSENQSIYVPLGEKHSLENPGKVPLELIEVQSGSYLGEDDIVRFDDLYGRN